MPARDFREEQAEPSVSSSAVLAQLDRLLSSPFLRSSKRSVQFLRYVVQKTLDGESGEIKERSIGIEVFGGETSYDTNTDHVVRTAAVELRRRLAAYYAADEHRGELRMALLPGSYVPKFSLPHLAQAQLGPELKSEEVMMVASLKEASIPGLPIADEVKISALGKLMPDALSWQRIALSLSVMLLVVAVWGLQSWQKMHTPQYLFWRPLLAGGPSLLIATGNVPSGPPVFAVGDHRDIPVIHNNEAPNLPFADAVTLTRISGLLQSLGRKSVIRSERTISFSDLRESPTVLIGLFNNEWSLRLSSQLRFSPALDPALHVIYIRDAKKPDARTWGWRTDEPVQNHGGIGQPSLQDYALISRIWDSRTGQTVVVVGGLYAHGTQAAGEFLTDPALFKATISLPLADPHRNVQIVLRTTVTDGVAGQPQVIATNAE